MSQDLSLRILVADDDHDTVDGLAFILRDEGHIVHGVYNGKDVLAAVSLFRPDPTAWLRNR